MMDFFVRESRAIVDGPMAIIRFGTCGGMNEHAVPGKVGVASGGSGYVVRNPDAFTHMYDNTTDSKTEQPYHYSRVCPSDAALNEVLIRAITEELGSDIIIEGTNITADSFYSSQGRIDDRFEDHNVDTVEQIIKHYPHAVTMEMETFTLLHLAKSCHIPIKATAAAIVLANRLSGKVVEGDVLKHIEEVGGKAVLHAVAKVEF
jgi:uridine phosphorylase